MSTTTESTTDPKAEPTVDTATIASTQQAGRARFFIQPLACVLLVIGCFVFVQVANVSSTEARSLSI